MKKEAKELVLRYIQYYFNTEVNSMTKLRKAINFELKIRGYASEIKKYKICQHYGPNGDISFYERE